MNKRGFIKTLEAVLAVMIVFIFIFTLSRGSNESGVVKNMKELQEGLLTGISQNDGFRNCIVKNNFEFSNRGGNDLCSAVQPVGLKPYIENTLPGRFKERYIIQVCDIDNCILPTAVTGSSEKNLYTSAVIISSDLQEGYKPKILRIWMW